MTRDPYKFKRLNERHEVIPARSLLEWAQWFEKEENRRVAATSINGWRVSTVFLAIDHSFGLSEKPLWFETMIFEDKNDPPPAAEMKTGFLAKWREECQWRYSTWDEALQGHETVVEMIRLGLF
jgi:hypothetical protein